MGSEPTPDLPKRWLIDEDGDLLFASSLDADVPIPNICGDRNEEAVAWITPEAFTALRDLVAASLAGSLAPVEATEPAIPTGAAYLLTDRGPWPGGFRVIVHADGTGHIADSGHDLTAVQVRHLIALPGRPHDERIDGRGDGESPAALADERCRHCGAPRIAETCTMCEAREEGHGLFDGPWPAAGPAPAVPEDAEREGSELDRRAVELLGADGDLRAARSRWEAAVHSIYDTANEGLRSWREDDIKLAVHAAVTRTGHEPFDALTSVLDRGGYWLGRALAARPSSPPVPPKPDGPGRVLATYQCSVQQAGRGVCSWPTCGCGDA